MLRFAPTRGASRWLDPMMTVYPPLAAGAPSHDTSPRSAARITPRRAFAFAYAPQDVYFSGRPAPLSAMLPSRRGRGARAGRRRILVLDDPRRPSHGRPQKVLRLSNPLRELHERARRA